MAAKINLIGRRYGKWLVMNKETARMGGSSGQRATGWWCQCECGTERYVDGASLRKGASTNCGCSRKYLKHGGTGTREYQSWNAMHQRCKGQQSPSYKGMKIAARWCGRKGFVNFLADMGPRPPGTSLDRKDGKKGYTPSNCRWATRRQQTENRSNARMVTLDGESMTFGRAYEVMHAALRDGKATFVIQTSAYAPQP